jgi:hypothetical protein
MCAARPHVHKIFKMKTNLVKKEKEKNLKFFFGKMCACGCGCKNWCAGASAAHYQSVCDLRAGAAENPRTLKV